MQNKIIIKEACVENIQQALNAELNGADRIELCSDLSNGGVTPSYGLIKLCKQMLKIPVFVIIRPRPGNFIYDEQELKIMKLDIENCIDLNVNGIVFGILDKNNKINLESIKFLLNSCNSKIHKTFHMAFDLIDNKEEAINLLIDFGFDRVLTRGGEGNALKNISRIKELILYSKNRIIIMPGGGITKENYEDIIKDSGIQEIHGTQIV